MSCPDEWADMQRRGRPEDASFFQFLTGQEWVDSDRVLELDRSLTHGGFSHNRLGRPSLTPLWDIHLVFNTGYWTWVQLFGAVSPKCKAVSDWHRLHEFWSLKAPRSLSEAPAGWVSQIKWLSSSCSLVSTKFPLCVSLDRFLVDQQQTNSNTKTLTHVPNSHFR